MRYKMSMLPLGIKNTPVVFSQAEVRSITDRAHAEALGFGEGSIGNALSGIGPLNYDSPMTAEMLVRAYTSSPLVSKLIGIGADAFAQLPMRTMMRERKANGRSVQKFSGMPYELLEWVNPSMTPFEIKRSVYSWRRLLGNAYWALEWTSPEYASACPMSIYPLNPMFVRIVPDPETGVKSYLYQVGADKIIIPADRVIHFKSFNPRDHWLGNPDAASLFFDIQIERYSKRQVRNYHANASMISGVLASEQEVGEPELKRLRREFREQNSGSNNAYRVLVLEKGMKYTPIPAANGDQFLEARLAAVADTHSMVLGVPMGLAIGKVEKGVKIIELESLMFKQNIRPFAEEIGEVLSKHLCTNVNGMLTDRGISSRVYIDFSFADVDALRLHDLDRVRTEVALVLGGLRTPNQIAVARGWETYDVNALVEALKNGLASFGDVPTPVYLQLFAQLQAMASAEASPSLSLPGSQGGRDQSGDGEAQMLDPTGTRSLKALNDEFLGFLKSFVEATETNAEAEDDED